MKIEKKKLKIDVYGQEYDLTIPTYLQSISYDDKLKECKTSSERAKCIFSHLESLGLPLEVSKNLTVDDMLELLKYISGEKKS